MGEEKEQRSDHDPYRTGINDHAWEREHRTPTAEQLRAIGHRRRDSELKLEQHLQEARHKNEDEKRTSGGTADGDSRSALENI